MLSVARGYDPNYLLKEVATGRENYYTGAVAEGEPPGRWWGAGAEALGLAGEVDAQDMNAVFKHFLDPRSDGFSDPARWGDVATLGHKGRAYKSAETLYAEALEREPDADPERRDAMRVQAGLDARQSLAFLDVTFSVQKSVTLLHTAFEAEEVKASHAGLDEAAAAWAGLRETVEEAIWAGNRAAMSYLQDQAGYARVGHHGGAAGRWIDAHGWIGASFFQHDSREHDPQLHIHNPVLNRQHSEDGVWRTLDSRAVYAMKPAAAAIAERTTNETLAARLGTEMAMRPDGLAREATCVTPATREAFSTRSTKLGARAEAMVAAFEQRYGRQPTALERDGLKREATLATRPAKSHEALTRAEVLDQVAERAARVVEGGLAGIAHTARAVGNAPGAERPVAGRFDAAQVIADAIETLQAKAATFSHAELVAEIDRHLPDFLDLPNGGNVRDLLHGMADRGMAQVHDIDRAGPGADVLPDALRLANGRSAYDAPGRRRGVTAAHLHSENRLRAATTARDGLALTGTQATGFVERLKGEGIVLGEDQAAALTGVLTSGARLECLVGPAGTGKSFVVGTLARAWADPAHRTAGEAPRRVFGLATAQIAAEVLRAEGLTASNTAAWLAAQRRLDSSTATGRAPLEADSAWQLRRGDVLVVDESSMADTADLAVVHAYAEAAGAKMLLVGDPRQLTAVGAGGAMDLVAQAGARYDLTDARRFTAEWERAASLRLRDGDPDAIDEYHRHGRIIDGGTREEAEASAARSWLADTLSGHRSLLIVGSNQAAARVSSSLRDKLVRLGKVDPLGLPLRDGTLAGVGDIVQGRRLAWELAGYDGNRRGAVNREHYRVVDVRDDGALDVVAVGAKEPFHPVAGDGGDAEAPAAGERLTLPPQYVAEDLTLAYAVTKHAAEGATVWSAHPVVEPGTDLPGLYVPTSRGAANNTMHVVTVTGPEDDAQGAAEAWSVHRDPRAVVAAILDSRDATDTANQAATAAVEDAARWSASVQTAAERFADAAHMAALERTGRHLDDLTTGALLGPVDRARIAAEDGTAALTRVLRQAELAGHHPAQVLHDAVAHRDLDTARRVSDVLLDRIGEVGPFEPIADTWAKKVPTDVGEDWSAHLCAVADAADTRTAALGAQLTENPPQWALDLLGPVPDATIADDDRDDGDGAAVDSAAARAEWQARAGAIAAHREIAGVDPAADLAPKGDADGATSARPGRSRDPITVLGAAPGRGQVETYSAYRDAHRATGLPDYTRDSLERSDTFHRAVVNSWHREQTWNSPAYVDNLLAATRQAEIRHRETAALRHAEARAADAPAEPDEHERLTREARYSAALADTLTEQVATLEQAAQTRAQWLVDTAAHRARAVDSEAHLAARGATSDPSHHVSADEWLTADRAARLDDDPHRDITDTDLGQTDDQADRTADQRDHDSAAHELDTADLADLRQEDEVHDASKVHDDRIDDRAHDERPEGPAREPAVEEEADDPRHERDRVDEDSVRVPDADDVDRIQRLAASVDIELRNRRSLEDQHEQDQSDVRADQLNRWHQDDHTTPVDTAGDADDD